MRMVRYVPHVKATLAGDAALRDSERSAKRSIPEHLPGLYHTTCLGTTCSYAPAFRYHFQTNKQLSTSGFCRNKRNTDTFVNVNLHR